MSKLKVYVGCALNNVDPAKLEAHMERVDRIKQILRDSGLEVLEFVGNDPEATCEEIFERDINGCCKDCDVMLALIDYPSTGLGFEIATCLALGKPVLALAEEGSSVSKLIRGVSHKNYAFYFYESGGEQSIPILLKAMFGVAIG